MTRGDQPSTKDLRKQLNVNDKAVKSQISGSAFLFLFVAFLVSFSRAKLPQMKERITADPPSIRDLVKRLQRDDKTVKRRGIVSFLCFSCMILLFYFYNLNSAQLASHAWKPTKWNLSILIVILLTFLGAVFTYGELAVEVVGEWLDLNVLDKQKKEEDELIKELAGGPSISYFRLHKRIEVELSAYENRSDILKLVVATFSALLIVSVSMAKSGTAALTILAATILSFLFFANTVVTYNRQTLRRLSWVALCVSQISSSSEKIAFSELPQEESIIECNLP